MLDDPDLDRDKMLSEHVMRMHSRNRKRKFDQMQSCSTSMKDENSTVAGSQKGFPMKGGKVGGTSQNPYFKEEANDDLSFMKSAFQS